MVMRINDINYATISSFNVISIFNCYVVHCNSTYTFFGAGCMLTKVKGYPLFLVKKKVK